MLSVLCVSPTEIVAAVSMITNAKLERILYGCKFVLQGIF